MSRLPIPFSKKTLDIDLQRKYNYNILCLNAVSAEKL